MKLELPKRIVSGSAKGLLSVSGIVISTIGLLDNFKEYTVQAMLYLQLSTHLDQCFSYLGDVESKI